MKMKDKKYRHIFHLEYSGPIPVTVERQPWGYLRPLCVISLLSFLKNLL